MFVPPSTDSRFQIIQDTRASKDNTLSVSELCRIANVSRSGYYRWVAAADSRMEREEQDQADFSLILQAYNHRGYAKGARSIYMTITTTTVTNGTWRSCRRTNMHVTLNLEFIP